MAPPIKQRENYSGDIRYLSGLSESIDKDARLSVEARKKLTSGVYDLIDEINKAQRTVSRAKAKQ